MDMNDWWMKDAHKLLKIIREQDAEIREGGTTREELYPHINPDHENMTVAISLLCAANQQLRTIRRLGICVLLVRKYC